MLPNRIFSSTYRRQAIQQHLQTTDSDNFDAHVEGYVIQEHNDGQISSHGTVAWERNIRHLHYIASLLTTCPTDLSVKPNQALPAAQYAYHTHLAIQESVFRPACHLRFHTEHVTQALYPVNWSAAAKNDAGVVSRAHMCTPPS